MSNIKKKIGKVFKSPTIDNLKELTTNNLIIITKIKIIYCHKNNHSKVVDNNTFDLTLDIDHMIDEYSDTLLGEIELIYQLIVEDNQTYLNNIVNVIKNLELVQLHINVLILSSSNYDTKPLAIIYHLKKSYPHLESTKYKHRKKYDPRKKYNHQKKS